MRKNFRTNRNRKVEKKNLNKFKKIKWKCIDHEKTTQKQKSVSGTLDVSGSFSSRSLKEYMDPAGVLKARTHSLHSINNWLSHSFLFLFTTSGSALIMKKQHKSRKVFLERLMFQGPLFIKIPQGIHGPCWRFEGQDPQPSLDQQLTFALISVSFHNKFFFFQFKILHASTTVLISKNDMVPYHPTWLCGHMKTK